MRYLFAPIVASLLYVAPSDAFAKTGSDEMKAAPVAAASVESEASTRAVPQATDDTVARDKAQYAAREAESKDAQQYRGGDTVVIGASAATAILAVVLLLVLI